MYIFNQVKTEGSLDREIERLTESMESIFIQAAAFKAIEKEDQINSWRTSDLSQRKKL